MKETIFNRSCFDIPIKVIRNYPIKTGNKTPSVCRGGRIMRAFVFGILLSFVLIAPVLAVENHFNTVRMKVTFNIGTFSDGEYDSGSVFMGISLSADLVSNRKTGLFCGLESGLLGGKSRTVLFLVFP
jgi:hypothetical protein